MQETISRILERWNSKDLPGDLFGDLLEDLSQSVPTWLPVVHFCCPPLCITLLALVPTHLEPCSRLIGVFGEWYGFDWPGAGSNNA